MADPRKTLLNLSDEEIMNLTPEQVAEMDAANATQAQANESQADDTNQGGDANENQETDQEDQSNAAEAAAAEQGADDEANEQTAAQAAPDGTEAGKGGDAEATADQAGKEEAGKTGADAKADAGKQPADTKPATPAAPAADDALSFQAKILAPFKANGRDMQVRDADEAIALMQKGANYHKKMEQLKPNLAIVESLKKANLLDQSKIDFLIDVALKKPEAISKLVQDSGIDPLDLTAEKAGGYQPTSHRVSPTEQALNEIWSELESSPGFDRTATVVAKEMDAASQALIAANPQVLPVIHAHIQSGMYDQITAEVERERTLGRLTGLSDLEAYRQVGDAMEAAGKFKRQESPAGQPAAPRQGTPAVPPVVQPKPKQADDSNRNDRKRAASPVRATSTAQKPVLKPLAMSDEDILKL